jgi:serine/threonine protein kinase
MHSAGIIHRGLKPSNILLNMNDDIKICDFNIVKS